MAASHFKKLISVKIIFDTYDRLDGKLMKLLVSWHKSKRGGGEFGNITQLVKM